MNKSFVRLCFFFLLIITLNSNRIFAAPQKPLTTKQVTSLALLGKTWGFLKYYHPKVAKGKYNWDQVLIDKIPVFLSASSQQEVSDRLLNWLNDLGPVDACPTCDNTLTGRLSYNLDTAWITNSGFTPEVISKLQFILANRSQGENYYAGYGKFKQIKVVHEDLYYTQEFKFPSPAYRLLTLFRYWNIVNYFSPYKYITTTKWDHVLTRFIPDFYEAKDTLQYHVSIIKLIAALGDGHCATNSWSTQLQQLSGDFNHLPFRCSIVEGKAVVTLITNDSLCKQQGIALNDVIVSVDGETVEKRVKRYLPYVYNASNDDARLQSICNSYLFSGHTGNCDITRLTPNGKIEKLTINRYTKETPYAPPFTPTWKILPDNIGYIDMGLLLQKDAKAVMDSLFATKGIIIDLRNYPNNTWHIIAARLTSKKFIMPRLAYPDSSYPGLYKYHPDIFGEPNTNPYKGKVILLVNVFSKSHSEYSAMGLQEAAKTITIGSTTAGADGSLTDFINLPGGILTRFSGLGVYYSDGTVAQKTGVKIDIVCKPTIKGVQGGKDELVEKAVSVINGN
ncbi:S41 family peptidase [Niastella sp. OAS944]|uniref:S41 family peptidase n=1 Tax=Niastella sp. OAS944 TaxID=2664089 RepID=UPI003494A42C|nr:C-terminal processing protease CtpA/Prc [Chitinophagaceae bacterium OAS944]